ncbi:MAG: tetratricopeptide repeat protein [Planctomycetota bacterium]
MAKRSKTAPQRTAPPTERPRGAAAVIESHAPHHPPRTGRTLRLALLSIAVGVVTFAVFLPALRNDFVAWDDPQALLNNPNFRGLGATQLKWMFTTYYWGHYQPLFWLSFALDSAPTGFSGLSARGVHRTSVLLHAVNAALLVLVAVGVLTSAAGTRGERNAWVIESASVTAALLWAVHPLRVEPVAWATGRGDVLVTLFSLLCVLAYLPAARAFAAGRYRAWLRWLALALLAYAGALLSRGMAITLPLVLIMLNVLVRRQHAQSAAPATHGRDKPGAHGLRLPAWFVVVEQVPFLLLAIIAGIHAFGAKGASAALSQWAEHGPLARLAQAAYGLVFYVWKTVVPLGLSPIYEIRLPLDLTEPRFVVAGVVVLAALIAAVVWGRRRPVILAAFAAYVLLVAPVLGLTQAGTQETADRYSYLPLIALFLLLAGGLTVAWSHPRWPRAIRAGLGLLSGAAAVILVALTQRQCGIWADTKTLFTYATQVRSDCSIAHNNYAYALMQEQCYDEALPHLRRALEIWPRSGGAHRNLWVVYRDQGRRDELLAALRESVRVFPEQAEPHFQLALELSKRGELAEAEPEYRAALRCDPRHIGAHTNLGMVLQQDRRYAEAAEHFEAGARDPSNLMAWRGWAFVLKRLGQTDKALEKLRHVLRVDRNDAEARRFWLQWTGALPP